MTQNRENNQLLPNRCKRGQELSHPLAIWWCQKTWAEEVCI